MKIELNAKFNPDHPNANIHGMTTSTGGQTCRTREGHLCTGCCTTFKVPEFNVKADSPCKHQEFGGGCEIIGDSKRERVCGDYHCSKNEGFYGGNFTKEQQRNINLQHLDHARVQGETTLDNATESMFRLSKK